MIRHRVDYRLPADTLMTVPSGAAATVQPAAGLFARLDLLALMPWRPRRRQIISHQERGCPTRPQPEPYQGGNRGPKRITGDAVPRRDKDGGMTRPERVFVF
jgi:hypothetical protein